MLDPASVFAPMHATDYKPPYVACSCFSNERSLSLVNPKAESREFIKTSFQCAHDTCHRRRKGHVEFYPKDPNGSPEGSKWSPCATNHYVEGRRLRQLTALEGRAAPLIGHDCPAT